jgi:hypothetical protein
MDSAIALRILLFETPYDEDCQSAIVVNAQI